MALKTYITWMGSIVATVWWFPGFTEFLQVYVIGLVVLVTVIINILFHLKSLRDLVVESIVQGFLADPDVRKIIDQKVRTAEFKKRVKEILREKRKAGTHEQRKS